MNVPCTISPSLYCHAALSLASYVRMMRADRRDNNERVGCARAIRESSSMGINLGSTLH
jgi:hypothetical protein